MAEFAASGAVDLPKRGDALALRKLLHTTFPDDFADAQRGPDVSYQTLEVETDDGETLEMRWYTRSGTPTGSAVVYAHGGGMLSGTIEFYDPVVSWYVQATGVPFLTVEYRLAPEVTGTTPARDVFAGVRWLASHAEDLGIDPERIAIMGDSAGGGIAAGVAILARDASVSLARQILVFPMLDDRTIEPDATLVASASWGYDDNYTGWHALLGGDLGTDRVSPYAAPARNDDFRHLPPAYIEVGSLDIFRDESVDYARRLWAAGVEAELHVLPGAPHGHDWLAYPSEYTARWKDHRFRAITTL